MFKAVPGVFRQGKVELKEEPSGVQEDTPVIVTSLNQGQIELRDHGIDPERAADLRARLAQFTEDWDRPEMDAYDDYDAADPGVAC